MLQVPDEYSGWLLPAIIGGLRVINKHQVDHILSSGPSWTNHLVGLALAGLKGIPWTAHFRDPWTQTLHLKDTSPLSRRIEARLERAVVTAAHRVVCVTEQHTEAMRHSYPALSPTTFVTIPNGYDAAEWDTLGDDRTGAPRCVAPTFVITYAGSLYHTRNPLPIFRAVRQLSEAGVLDLGQIRIDLIGWCDSAQGRGVWNMAVECGVQECVTIHGPLGRPETARRLCESSLLLLLAEDQPLQIPGKTYEYLRTGNPILALTRDGALADLLRETGGAYIVDPANQPELIKILHNAYQNWREGRHGPTADVDVVATFDRRVLAGAFARLFDASVHLGAPGSTEARIQGHE